MRRYITVGVSADRSVLRIMVADVTLFTERHVGENRILEIESIVNAANHRIGVIQSKENGMSEETRRTLGSAPERPELEAALRAAVAAYEALPPVDRAIHDMAQRRSFVRGQMEDTPNDRVDTILDEKPEFVILSELLRLRGRQAAAWKWAQHVFGPEGVSDKLLRALRFMEEAAELTQAIGLIREDAHRMIDVVYDRAPGEARQEVGGVMLTLMVLSTCCAVMVDAALADEQERVWLPAMIEKIRGRQATKPQPTRPEAGS